VLCWTEWLLMDGQWAGRRRPLLQRLAALACVLPLLLMALAVLLDWSLVTAGYASRDFTLAQRLLTETRALWMYLVWILLPAEADFGFIHDDFPLSAGLLAPWTTLPALLAWLLLLALALRFRRRWPLACYGLGFFLVTHAMESSILPLEPVFEHRNYLPSFGLLLPAVYFLWLLGRRLARFSRGWVAALVLVVACGLLVPFAHRLWIWSDPVRMARQAALLHPSSARAQYLLGEALEQPAQAFRRRGEDPLPVLLEARDAYLAMRATGGEGIASLVVLYRLDSRYFPGNPQQGAWLEAIIPQLTGERLSASERNALAALVACATTSCPVPPRTAERLLDAVDRSYPADASLRALRVRYRLQSGEPELARKALAPVAALAPDSILLAQLKLELAATEGEGSAVLEALLTLYARDRNHRDLPRFAAMLGDGG